MPGYGQSLDDMNTPPAGDGREENSPKNILIQLQAGQMPDFLGAYVEAQNNRELIERMISILDNLVQNGRNNLSEEDQEFLFNVIRQAMRFSGKAEAQQQAQQQEQQNMGLQQAQGQNQAQAGNVNLEYAQEVVDEQQQNEYAEYNGGYSQQDAEADDEPPPETPPGEEEGAPPAADPYNWQAEDNVLDVDCDAIEDELEREICRARKREEVNRRREETQSRIDRALAQRDAQAANGSPRTYLNNFGYNSPTERRYRSRQEQGLPDDPSEGRDRTIVASKRLSSANYDPMMRLYRTKRPDDSISAIGDLASYYSNGTPAYMGDRGPPFEATSDRRICIGLDGQHFNAPNYNQRKPSFFSVAQDNGDSYFMGSEETIAMESVAWSYNGWTIGPNPGFVHPRKTSAAKINLWNRTIGINEINEAAVNQITQLDDTQDLVYTAESPVPIGSTDGFNLASSLIETWNSAIPNLTNINMEYVTAIRDRLNSQLPITIGRSGNRITSVRAAPAVRRKLLSMLEAGGITVPLDLFFRIIQADQNYRGTKPLSNRPRFKGGDLFRYIIKGHLNLGSRVDADPEQITRVAMAGMTSQDVINVVSSSYIETEYYDFEAFTGPMRDLYGHYLSLDGNNMNGNYYGYIDPEYNYYLKNYEDAIGSRQISETLLPNFYTYILATQPGSNVPDELEFLGSENRNSTLVNDAVQQITLGEFNQNVLPNLVSGDMHEYFETWTNATSQGVAPSIIGDVNRLFKTLNVPASMVNDLDQESGIFARYNAAADSFPMSIKIGVPTGPVGTVGNLIERTGTSTVMTNIFINQAATPNPQEFIFETNGYKSTADIEDPFGVDIQENAPQDAKLAISSNASVYDFNDWWEAAAEEAYEVYVLANPESEEEQSNSREQGDIPGELLTLGANHYMSALKNAAKAAAATEATTYSEAMVLGKKCRSETIIYKLRKLKTVAGNDTPAVAGEFFFANTQLSKIIEYVDTQVIYNRQYQYELYGYELVYGSRFRFRSNDSRYSAGAWTAQTQAPTAFSFMVETLPNIKIIEYPIFTNRWQTENVLDNDDRAVGGVSYPPVRVIDRPPIPPGVFVASYKDKYKNVLFNFEIRQDEYINDRAQSYIAIDDEDTEAFDLISKTQKLQDAFSLPKGKAEFKSEGEEEIEEIQIFRTEEINLAATSVGEVYKSFSGKLHHTVEKSKGRDFVDTLEPNKIYFYTFRSVDRHEQVSNPTEIYKIQLHYKNGVYIPRIQALNIEKMLTKPQVPSKRMVRYLEIKAAEIQTEPITVLDDTGRITTSQKSMITNSENKVTTNKYLIRLTSKDTGKKINLVIDFTDTEPQ